MFALFVASLHGGEDIMFGGEEGSSRAGGDTDLVVDVLDVVVYGLLRNDELTGDLLFGVTTCDQTQDFNLTPREACHEFAAGAADRVTRGREHAICCFTIEPSRACFAAQLFGSDFR